MLDRGRPAAARVRAPERHLWPGWAATSSWCCCSTRWSAEAVAGRIVDSLRVPVWIDGTMLRPSLSLGLGVDRRGRRGRLRTPAPCRRRNVRREDRREEPVPAVPAGDDEVTRGPHRAGGRAAASPWTPARSPCITSRSSRPGSASWSRSRRWPAGCATARLVPPKHFIPAAERSGLIVEIGTEVLLQRLHRAEALAGRRTPPGPSP